MSYTHVIFMQIISLITCYHQQLPAWTILYQSKQNQLLYNMEITTKGKKSKKSTQELKITAYRKKITGH